MSWLERPPAWFRHAFPDALFRTAPQAGDNRTVWLTFDDGPVPEATPWVLDILDRFGVQATFFMVADNARRYPELLDEVRKRGHSVGNHTYHHLHGLRTPTRDFLRDVFNADRVLHTPLFRPPHGFLRPAQAKALSGHFRTVMFDLVSRDYSNRLTPANVVSNVKRLVRPGSIVVFHDSVKAMPRLRGALPEILEWFRAEGWDCRRLDDSPCG